MSTVEDKIKTDNRNDGSVIIKEMSYPEFYEYVSGQLDKAISEGDKAAPRIIALKQIISDATKILKKIAGAKEDQQSKPIQVRIYQEPHRSVRRYQTTTTMPKAIMLKKIDQLLAKVDELCNAIREENAQEKTSQDKSIYESIHESPANMTASDKSDVQKNSKKDITWGVDPYEVRHFRI